MVVLEAREDKMGKHKQYHLNRNALIEKAKAESLAFMASGRAVKLISLIVLHQEEGFNFDADQLRLFLDRFEEVLEYYNTSKSYQDILAEWDDYFKDLLGESILWR